MCICVLVSAGERSVMDNYFATSAGNTAGAGPDGAFERFLTAAIATIITIMFSWRLLAEMTENSEEGDVRYRTLAVSEADRGKYKPIANAVAVTANGSSVDSPSTSAKQCMSDSDWKVSDDKRECKPDITPFIESNATELLSSAPEKLVPSDYREILSDDLYTELQLERPQSLDLLDEDETCQPRIVDSDEEMFFRSYLEPILEEESDDLRSISSDGSYAFTMGQHDVSFDSSLDTPTFLSEGADFSDSDQEVEDTTPTSDVDHVRLFTNGVAGQLLDKQQTIERESAKFDSGARKYNNGKAVMSPVRTNALDDFFDDSQSDASSESVITVINLRIEEDDEYLSTEPPERDILSDPLKSSSLYFNRLPVQTSLEINDIRLPRSLQRSHSDPSNRTDYASTLNDFDSIQNNKSPQDLITVDNSSDNLVSHEVRPDLLHRDIHARINNFAARDRKGEANLIDGASSEEEDEVEPSTHKHKNENYSYNNDGYNSSDSSSSSSVEGSYSTLDYSSWRPRRLPKQYGDGAVSSALEENPLGFVFSRCHETSRDSWTRNFVIDRKGTTESIRSLPTFGDLSCGNQFDSDSTESSDLEFTYHINDNDVENENCDIESTNVINTTNHELCNNEDIHELLICENNEAQNKPLSNDNYSVISDLDNNDNSNIYNNDERTDSNSVDENGSSVDTNQSCSDRSTEKDIPLDERDHVLNISTNIYSENISIDTDETAAGHDLPELSPLHERLTSTINESGYFSVPSESMTFDFGERRSSEEDQGSRSLDLNSSNSSASGDFLDTRTGSKVDENEFNQCLNTPEIYGVDTIELIPGERSPTDREHFNIHYHAPPFINKPQSSDSDIISNSEELHICEESTIVPLQSNQIKRNAASQPSTNASDEPLESTKENIKSSKVNERPSVIRIPTPAHSQKNLIARIAYSGHRSRADVVSRRDLFKTRTKEQSLNSPTSKEYVSVLNQPVSPDVKRLTFDVPASPVSKSRFKINTARRRFLSHEDLLGTLDEVEKQFDVHRESFKSPQQRNPRNKYSREKSPSTPQLTTISSVCNEIIKRLSSAKYLDKSIPPNIDELHEDCIFSPQKQEQLKNRTLSMDNLQSHLLRYGSVSSLVVTDIDTGETSETPLFAETDVDSDFSFQYSPSKTVSMMDLTTEPVKPKKAGKGRFADRHLAKKSKSMQYLQTDIDAEDPFIDREVQSSFGRTPSVHELRVTQSLQKLSVPDWFKRSKLAGLGSGLLRKEPSSTHSSMSFQPSLTSSPCSGNLISPGAIVHKTRVSPSSSRLFMSSRFQATSPKSPMSPPAQIPTIKLPSERYRQEKAHSKSLMPVPIVPFSQLRAMFEKKSTPGAQTIPKENGTVSPPHLTTNDSQVKDTRKQTQSSDSKKDHKSILKPTPAPRVSVPPKAKPKSPKMSPEVISNQQTQFVYETPPLKIEPSKKQTVIIESVEQTTFVANKHTNNREYNPTTVRNARNANENVSVHAQNERTYVIPSDKYRLQNNQRLLMPSKDRPNNAIRPVTTGSVKGKDNFSVSFTDLDNCIDKLHNCDDGANFFTFLQKQRCKWTLEKEYPPDVTYDDRDEHSHSYPVLSLGKHSSMHVHDHSNVSECKNNSEIRVINVTSSSGDVNSSLKDDATMEEVLAGLLALRRRDEIKRSKDEHSELTPSHSDAKVIDPYIDNVENNDLQTEDNFYNELMTSQKSDIIFVTCRYPSCRRTCRLNEAKHSYKNCHHCYTYYCSRACRKKHWARHKQKCPLSRISSACKHIVKRVNGEPEIQYQLSRLARRGYLSQGRGCVMLAFTSHQESVSFLQHGFSSLCMPPSFVGVKSLEDAPMLGDCLLWLKDMCAHYNPELKYVLHVSIIVDVELPLRSRKTGSIMQKCAKLRLSPAHMHPKEPNVDGPSTLILTAVPGGPDVDNISHRKAREVCFINIQRKLRNRGVSLRHNYPDVYNKFIDYVAEYKHFTPVILYPYDVNKCKRFMCIIMPESDPDIEWMDSPDLLQELDLSGDDMFQDTKQ